MCVEAGNFMQKCEGILNCDYYKEDYHYKDHVYVIDKELNKKKSCIFCDGTTKSSLIDISYDGDKGKIFNKLQVRICEKCNRKYLSDTIFRSYTQNKDVKDIDIIFEKMDF